MEKVERKFLTPKLIEPKPKAVNPFFPQRVAFIPRGRGFSVSVYDNGVVLNHKSSPQKPGRLVIQGLKPIREAQLRKRDSE